MAGYQSSTTKLYNDSSSLTSASYSPSPPNSSNQSLIQLPTTPTSPAPSFSNSSTTKNSTTTNSNTNNNSSSSTTNSPKTITSSNNSASTTPTANNSNSNSPAASRSLTNNNSSANNSPSSNPQSLPHSAFTPYQNSPQHPTPVTTPTSIPKNPLSQQAQQQPDPTMMTSHLDNGSSPTLGYPPHTHFTNPATPFWQQQWPVGGNGTNGVAVATLAQQGGSAFMPTYGGGAGGSMPPHNPRPKLTTTIWEDEATLCYQVDARGICVARRQDNDMINGTKLLNVVGMSRGKRDGILKNEKGRVVVKVGAMHLKGVWITFQRAKTLAAQFKIGDILYPLFVDDPSVFLHSSYAAPMNRIPSMGAGAGNNQWRGQPHPFANTFNNQYAEGRPWGYSYGNNNPVAGMLPPTSASQGSRTHTPHPPQHIEEEYTNYNLMNGQNPQGQPGVVVSSGVSLF
ncbi:8909_t:CDS:2 [Ambispora gerdemannii]|uniref:8909_t:CDS:1 n=1 Tax=Ambispora gerdemannii TaxID=144530 RepID=A0A9N8VIG0_9GLOM|nr:8909_t:CDS:2 [Ambispora gerdemannii]